MKVFNIQATRTTPIHASIIKHYALVISAFIIILTGYTYYIKYRINQQLRDSPEQQEPDTIYPIKTSAVRHFIHILEHIPQTIILTHVTITQTTIVLKGSLRNKNSLSSFLKEIAPYYTIIQARTTDDNASGPTFFTLELHAL